MEIHKPKAAHSWREFLIEIGTITCGILIALGLERAAEARDWAHKVAVAEKAMTDEISADDGPQIYQRAALDHCLTEKLDAIEHGLDLREDRQAIIALIRSYRLPSLSYDTQQRDAVNNSGVAVHIPERQYSAWSKIYADIPSLGLTAAQEARDLGQLYALRSGGGALSDAEADRIFVATEALRADESVMFAAARWTLPQIAKAGMKLDPDQVAKLMAWARAHYPSCLSHIPTHWDGGALSPERQN